MYTYAPLEGQEAISVGMAFAMRKEDWFFPTYRESFVYHVRGLPLDVVNLGWMGMEEGLKLDRLEGLQVVCATDNGAVITVYRNSNFRSLRRRNVRWTPAS